MLAVAKYEMGNQEKKQEASQWSARSAKSTLHDSALLERRGQGPLNCDAYIIIYEVTRTSQVKFKGVQKMRVQKESKIQSHVASSKYCIDLAN